MVTYRFLFHFFAGLIFFLYGAKALVVLLKRRTKYNLAMLLVLVIFLVGTILDYLYPNRLAFVGDWQIPLLVVFSVLIFIFLFYQEFQGFIRKRKAGDK